MIALERRHAPGCTGRSSIQLQSLSSGKSTRVVSSLSNTPSETSRWWNALHVGQSGSTKIVAGCTAPGGGDYKARVLDIPPQITRGTGSNTRYVTNILPETDPGAESLLVVEVITPAGNLDPDVWRRLAVGEPLALPES